MSQQYIVDPDYTRFPFLPLPYNMNHLAVPGELMIDYNAGIAFVRSREGDRDIQLNDPTAQYHIEDYNNPHKVTKEQVGLGNVKNELQASELDLKRHKDDHNNPHMVTKQHVGLGNVPNVEQVSKEELETFRTAIDNYIADMNAIIESIGGSISKKYDLSIETEPADAIVKVFYDGKWNEGKLHRLPNGTYQYEVEGPSEP